jgi:hypothetical protein
MKTVVQDLMLLQHFPVVRCKHPRRFLSSWWS